MPLKDPVARREYHRLYMKQWYANNKEKHLKLVQTSRSVRQMRVREQINQLKTKPCLDCNQSFDPVCMDFDHTEDNKLESVSQLVARGVRWEIIEKEIAKCDLVCSNCHRIRTKTRKIAA